MVSKALQWFKQIDSKQYTTQLSDARKESEKHGFNIFSLSNYNAHYENFHSDIIAELLKPNGLHNEKNIYLNLFINYLNTHFNLSINTENYSNAEVHREKHRIDVGILDKQSGKAIIIENKINNAPDADEQLLRYYRDTLKDNLQIEAVIYITLDGVKQPATFKEIKSPVIPIGAVTNQPNCLCAGWIELCEKASTGLDSQSFIYQYKKLLLSLNSHAMQTNTLDEFYNEVNTEEQFEHLATLNNLSQQLILHRVNKWVSGVTNYSPFTRSFRYKFNHYIFQDYKENGSNYKLDFWLENHSKAAINIWLPQDWQENPQESRESIALKLENKLANVGYLSDFTEIHNEVGRIKRFELGNGYATTQQMDAAIIDFLNKFLQKLRDSKS